MKTNVLKSGSYYFNLSKVLAKVDTHNVTPGLVMLHSLLSGWDIESMYFDRAVPQKAADDHAEIYHTFVYDNMVIALRELCMVTDHILQVSSVQEYGKGIFQNFVAPDTTDEIVRALMSFTRAFSNRDHFNALAAIIEAKSAHSIPNKGSLNNTVYKNKYMLQMRNTMEYIADVCDATLNYKRTIYKETLKPDIIKGIAGLLSMVLDKTYLVHQKMGNPPWKKGRYNLSNEVVLCLANNYESVIHFNMFVDSTEISSRDSECLIRELFDFKKNL